MEFYFWDPGNIAVFLLALVAGYIVSYLFTSKGCFSSFLTYMIALIVLIILVSALVRGYSFFIENITYNLQEYIYFNGTGVIGFIVGFAIRSIGKRNK